VSDDIRKVMRRLADECRDRDTGEINCTKLAEETANALDLYESDDDCTIPEEVYDLAVDVAQEFEGKP